MGENSIDLLNDRLKDHLLKELNRSLTQLTTPKITLFDHNESQHHNPLSPLKFLNYVLSLSPLPCPLTFIICPLSCDFVILFSLPLITSLSATRDATDPPLLSALFHLSVALTLPLTAPLCLVTSLWPLPVSFFTNSSTDRAHAQLPFYKALCPAPFSPLAHFCSCVEICPKEKKLIRINFRFLDRNLKRRGGGGWTWRLTEVESVKLMDLCLLCAHFSPAACLALLLVS
jgi:hypothetical protein